MSLPSRILILVTGLKGRLFSTLEVANRLASSGSKIIFACPAERSREIKSWGYEYVQLPSTSYDTTKSKNLSSAIDSLGVNNLDSIISEINPGFLLIDIELAPHIIVSRTLKIPMALLSSWFSLVRVAGIPPLTSSIIPAESSKRKISQAWAKYNRRRSWHFLSKRLRWRKLAYREVLRELAHQHKINLEEEVQKSDYFALPFYWPRLPILSMNAQELDFPSTLPSNVHYVGPMVFHARVKKERTAAAYQLSGDFIAKHADRKLAYCSFSSMSGSDDTLQGLLDAAKEMEDWCFIVASQTVDQNLAQENILYLKAAPQLSLLEQCDLSINHGGINTINECLQFAKPMLILDGEKFDQSGCAARIAYHGLGRRMSKGASPDLIRQQIREITEEKVLSTRVQEFKESIAYYASSRVLEHKLIDLVSEPRDLLPKK